MNKNHTFYLLQLLLGILLSACGAQMGDSANEMEQLPMDEVGLPADLDTARTRLSQEGLYEATIRSEVEPVKINQIHRWILHVETADGKLVEGAQITIDGGMPEHNHGFATQPQVTDYLGDGDYLVEGVKFQMSGWWEMRFEINANGVSDEVTFNVVLP